MAPRDLERLQRAALLRSWREALGETPAQRLRWLLDFAYGRLESAPLTAGDCAKLRFALLVAVQDATAGAWTILEPPVGVTPSPETALGEIRAAQQAVRRAVEALAGGRLYTPKVPVRLFARLGPREIPAPPTPREQFVLVRMFIAPLPEAAGVAAMELIGQVRPRQLRRCPYISDPPERMRAHADLPTGACGQVFVAVRRQKYCQEHREKAREAAVQRALERFREKQHRAKRRKKGGAR